MSIESVSSDCVACVCVGCTDTLGLEPFEVRGHGGEALCEWREQYVRALGEC